MLNIFLQGGKNLVDGIIEERGTHHSVNLKIHNIKNHKKKKPEQSLEQQFNKLQEYCQDHNLRRLQLKGFKGTFKIENWINMETNLRNMKGLKQIGFVDTQLDKVHLDVLSRWLSWVEPQKLIIELQQNELDDDDITEFLYSLFERNIDVRSIYIISNPGIYKGALLKELKEYLQKKFEKNMIYYYKLIKNKQALSMAIIRLSRKDDDQKINKKVKQAEVKIDQTQYYKLVLKNCFTNKNWKGFQHLIQITYQENNLEQLTYLDISDNFLGTQNVFNSMLTLISSSKGLLVLKIADQPLIHNSQNIELLLGNRYDKLKLRELDISNNKDMAQKAFELLSNNIFKFWSLPQELPTIQKMFVMTETFASQTKENKQLYRKKKQFRRDYLQILDLSSVENDFRHDLVENLLNNTVFTEFSRIRMLYVQNLDVGRCKAFINAKRNFLAYMKRRRQMINSLKTTNIH